MNNSEPVHPHRLDSRFPDCQNIQSIHNDLCTINSSTLVHPHRLNPRFGAGHFRFAMLAHPLPLEMATFLPINGLPVTSPLR
jgi:hypothetical protein